MALKTAMPHFSQLCTGKSTKIFSFHEAGCKGTRVHFNLGRSASVPEDAADEEHEHCDHKGQGADDSIGPEARRRFAVEVHTESLRRSFTLVSSLRGAPSRATAAAAVAATKSFEESLRTKFDHDLADDAEENTELPEEEVQQRPIG
jgi:hypothetical protein